MLGVETKLAPHSLLFIYTPQPPCQTGLLRSLIDRSRIPVNKGPNEIAHPSGGVHKSCVHWHALERNAEKVYLSLAFILFSYSTIQFAVLGRFPKVRSGRPDHGRTSHFYNEKGFLEEFLLENYFLRPYHKGLTDLAGYFLFSLRREWSFGQFWQMESTLSLRKHKAPV